MSMLYLNKAKTLIITGGFDDLYFKHKFSSVLEVKAKEDSLSTRKITTLHF